MNNVHHATAGDNLPLFRWAEAHCRRHDPAPAYSARFLARRHHLPLRRARLVAELAGFAMEAR